MLTKRRVNYTQTIVEKNAAPKKQEDFDIDEQYLIDEDGFILSFLENEDELSIESNDETDIVECGTNWASIAAPSKKSETSSIEERAGNQERIEVVGSVVSSEIKDTKETDDISDLIHEPKDETCEDVEYEEILVESNKVLVETAIQETPFSTIARKQKSATGHEVSSSKKNKSLGSVIIDSKALLSISLVVLFFFTMTFAIWQGFSWRLSALRLEDELQRLRSRKIPIPDPLQNLKDSSNQGTTPIDDAAWKFDINVCFPDGISSVSFGGCATEVAGSVASATSRTSSRVRDVALSAWDAATEYNHLGANMKPRSQTKDNSHTETKLQTSVLSEMWNSFLSEVSEKGMINRTHEIVEYTADNLRHFFHNADGEGDGKNFINEASELLAQVSDHSLQSFSRWANATSGIVSSKVDHALRDLHARYKRQEHTKRARETLSRWCHEVVSNGCKRIVHAVEYRSDRMEKVFDSLWDRWIGDDK